MKNFLFAWELGANFGHLNRDRQVATCLRARGHSVNFAVKNTRIATELLVPHSFDFVQAPISQTKYRQLRAPANYAEILLVEGWGDRQSLSGLLRAWLTLFDMMKPDTLIADHAPTALLAAHIAGIPAVAFGNGFEIPPPVSPMPSIRTWENIETSRLAQSEKFVLDQANAASAALGGKQLTHLLDIFPPKSILAGFVELDHYGERDNVIYIGSVYGIKLAEQVTWSKTEGKKILAYLRPDQKITEDILSALVLAGKETICMVPDISQTQMRKYASHNLRIYSRPIAFDALLAGAGVVISYGGSGTVAESLLAGVPLILIPYVIEQYLGAKAVEKLGAGILLGETRDKNAIGEAINKMLTDSSFQLAAQGFAEKYRGSTTAQSAELAAEAIIKTSCGQR